MLTEMVLICQNDEGVYHILHCEVVNNRLSVRYVKEAKLSAEDLEPRENFK